MRVVSRGAQVAAWLVLSSLGLDGAGCDKPKPVTPPPPVQDSAPPPARVEPKPEAGKEPGAPVDKDPSQDKKSAAADGPAGPKPPLPPVAAEPAPAASPRLTEEARLEPLKQKVESYYQGHAGRRIHIQTDKPLYKPGETIWLKVWDVTARALSGSHGGRGMHVELISPRGSQVMKRKVREQGGMGQVDLPLGDGMAGGEYTLRVLTLDGIKHERPVVVASYEQPRLKMQLEFVRKAYGGGDEVNATIAVKRPTGEPLKNHTLTAAVRLDGQDLPRVTLQTDAQGEGLVRFQLPQEIALGDGLLTVLADDGGLTESIAKRVPIILKKLMLSVYPEGGDLVEGVPGRIYFEAKNPLGKPADIAGHLVDDAEQTVARFESVRDGLGRVDFTPMPGRHYHLEIDRPVGVADQYPVPTALTAGCVLRSIDDLDGQQLATRVSVRCTQARKVLLAATLRDGAKDEFTVLVNGIPVIEETGETLPTIEEVQAAVRQGSPELAAA